MSYLGNITRLSGATNLGGVLTLLVARKDDVESIPEPSQGTIFGDITMKAGKQFYSWEVTTESPRTRSDSRSTREGATKRNALNFTIPKDRADIKNQLDQAEDDEFILIFTDANGKTKIFGLLDTPVKFEFDHDSGAAFSNLNAYDCRFYYEGPDNLYHYDGTLPTAPVGTAPAIVRYNGVAIASLAPGETLNIISDFGFTDFYITA
jgi:hypothetical protein